MLELLEQISNGLKVKYVHVADEKKKKSQGRGRKKSDNKTSEYSPSFNYFQLFFPQKSPPPSQGLNSSAHKNPPHYPHCIVPTSTWKFWTSSASPHCISPSWAGWCHPTEMLGYVLRTLIGLTPQKGKPCTAVSIKMLTGCSEQNISNGYMDLR